MNPTPTLPEIITAGQRIGRLTMVERTVGYHRSAFWECVCDCSAPVRVSQSQLRRRKILSCGCGQRGKNGKTIVEPGYVSGKLTVLGPAPTINGEKMWRCRCECNAEHIARGSHLAGKKTRSCGCGHLRPQRAAKPDAPPEAPRMALTPEEKAARAPASTREPKKVTPEDFQRIVSSFMVSGFTRAEAVEMAHLGNVIITPQ